MDLEDDVSTSTDVEDLMGETDVDEESVNITADSSSLSTKTTRLDVTDSKGKLDISKIRSWTIPKLNTSRQHKDDTSSAEKEPKRVTRHSITTCSAGGLQAPQAQSTPQVHKGNRSMTLQTVRDRLKPRVE